MSSSPSHSFFGNQRGGTFLGLVIGLLVGLAVAFVVAIYVSKVPIPFVDKGVSRDPGEEAAEAKRNKDWDPNAPLYGRNAPRPQKKGDEGSEADAQAAKLPAPASSPTPAPAPAAGPVLPPDGANVPPAPTNASDPDAANDPLGAFARSRVQASDPFNYFVQAGAFRTQADADALSAKLQQQGFDTKVTEREQAGRMVYRVRVGPLSTKEEAEAVQVKFKSIKIDAALVRVQR
ncbi:MAG: hypothetical protein RL111_2192 [Pseudomonadota bacterium]|jgi:cell division protein FtsN